MRSDRKAFARLFGLVVLGVLALAALFGGSLGAQAGVAASIPASDPASKIDRQVLKDTANGQKASFVILLAEQADLSAGYSMKDQDARGWYVYNTLRDTAARTQAPIRAALTAAGVPYQPYWAANMIVATGDLSLVQSLAARPDVRAIESNHSFKGIDDALVSTSSAPASPDTVEWGVQDVNAPQVWAQGYTGQGMVVGNEDTGMRWTQVAIKPKYRGWNGSTADHNYNWWDAIHTGGGICGANSLFPCDDSGHGTHTTGTTTGDDGTGDQIGVAPGAKWIGCRNMDQGNGTPARYTECFQFFIAPTDLNGQNPNPALRPDVINNSWTCPPSEGCAPNTLETIVENTQAAGIFVEASAGNSGSGCSTVSDPPAIYAASFSTGAIDISNALAGFSSRGPVTSDSSNRLKPDISAPGVNVRSSYNTNDTSFASLSGTSMAGPHVVGVVALIWSARPSLVRDITGTKQLLEQTANPNVTVSPPQTCGGIPSNQIPNNSFGYGRVDALAAFNASGGGTPTPTNTPGIPTATSTSTNTPIAPTATFTSMPTATPTVCGDNVIQNPGFETGTLPPWVIRDSAATPTVTTDQHHSGNYSALLGMISGNWGGDSSIYQQVTVPPSGGTLSFWYYADSCDACHFDYQDAYVTDLNGNILATVMHIQCVACISWFNQTYDMAAFAGQTVRIEFLVHHDIFGGWNYMYVDDVSLLNVCTTPTPTVTGTPPTATSTRTSTATLTGTTTPTPTVTGTPPTATSTPTVTPTVCGGNVIQNGDFATGSFPPWVILDTNPTPTIIGTPPGPCCAQVGSVPGPEPLGDSSFYQQITVPAEGGTLSYWYYPFSQDTIAYDWQDAYVTDTSHNILATIMHVCDNSQTWTNVTFNMTPYAGMTVDIEFLVHQDGFGDVTNMCVTDVVLINGCATSTPAAATPTNTFTTTPTTNTPTNTPTAVPSSTSEPIDLVPQFSFYSNGGGGCAASLQPASFGFQLTTANVYSSSVPVSTTMRFSGPENSSMDIQVPPFAGSYTYDYDCAGPVPCPPGAPHTFTLTVDLNNVIVETNEGNNTLSQTIYTNPPPTGTPCPPTPIPTHTPGTPTDTPVPGTATATPTTCALTFVDVHSTDWFYNYVVWMYCNGIISGYHSSPPCGVAGEACFKPNNWSTRAQVSKIVVLGFGVPINTTGGPHFQDVPVGSTFYNYIETLDNLGAVSGYPCGEPGYPCVPPANLPYFKPDLNVTRGQLTKILILGASIPINTTNGPHFQDVPGISVFYPYVETLFNLGSIHGYPCGGSGEPCIPPDNRAYFRPGNNVTRAQLSQIVFLSQHTHRR